MEDIRGEEKLPRSMFGFIQNSGITKASKAMKEEKKSKPMLWFVDVSSASDNIRRGKIYRKIREYGLLSDKEAQVIKYLHKEMRAKEGETEVKIERERFKE